MYYITITAKRKDAKRHIYKKCQSLEECQSQMKNINSAYTMTNGRSGAYTVEIYDGKWEKMPIQK